MLNPTQFLVDIVNQRKILYLHIICSIIALNFNPKITLIFHFYSKIASIYNFNSKIAYFYHKVITFWLL